MNVIIVSNYYFPEIGAAPNRITNLASGLSENYVDVSVICPLPNYPKGRIFEKYRGKLRARDKYESTDIYRYWIYPSNSSNTIKRTLSMFSFAVSLWLFAFRRKQIKNADWIIIQNPPLLVSYSSIILFKKIYRKKIALNISDLWPLSALELGAIKEGGFYRFLERIEKFNYKNSDMIIGQSNEILDHVNQITLKPNFLYRNLQKSNTYHKSNIDNKSNGIRIIYAGLLGVAQGIYHMIKEINFKDLGVTFDIYGEGFEKEKIEEFIIKNPDRGVSYKGSKSKSELDQIIINYDVSIVPLVNRIKGAVPSKIFELMKVEIPILFCGGGEGAKIVENYEIGFISPPGDYKQLEIMILKMNHLSQKQYRRLKDNCKKISNEIFNFDLQIRKLIESLANEGQ